MSCGYRYETIALYCPSPACRHEWEAELLHDSAAHYHDLDDPDEAYCPECGEEGDEERPVWDEAELSAIADTPCELCGGETSAAGTCDHCWEGVPDEE